MLALDGNGLAQRAEWVQSGLFLDDATLTPDRQLLLLLRSPENTSELWTLDASSLEVRASRLLSFADGFRPQRILAPPAAEHLWLLGTDGFWQSVLRLLDRRTLAELAILRIPFPLEDAGLTATGQEIWATRSPVLVPVDPQWPHGSNWLRIDAETSQFLAAPDFWAGWSRARQGLPSLEGPCPDLLPCTADCDGDRTVNVAELVLATRVALGSASRDSCAMADQTGDGSATVEEVVRGVQRALSGCELEPTVEPQ